MKRTSGSGFHHSFFSSVVWFCCVWLRICVTPLADVGKRMKKYALSWWSGGCWWWKTTRQKRKTNRYKKVFITWAFVVGLVVFAFSFYHLVFLYRSFQKWNVHQGEKKKGGQGFRFANKVGKIHYHAGAFGGNYIAPACAVCSISGDCGAARRH